MLIIDAFKQIFTKEEVESGDGLGAYPQKVHVPAFLERRYLKASRVLAIFAMVSTCITIMLSCILFILPPMVRTEPYSFAYSPSLGSFTYIDEIEVVKPSQTIIMESLIREYIFLRHLIVSDIDEMNKRWEERSKFYWYSSGEVYSIFMSAEAKRLKDKVRTAGFRQDVFFRWTQYIKRNHWMAEFDTYEYLNWQTKQAVRRRWRAFIHVAYNPRRFYGTEEDKLKNPLAFTVMEYKISSLEITD